ncbi:coiled-coil domain-containing protein 43 [Sitophilus oryzae]|uniref:Coiled-coil domain-containing protein 43 n=1 Tax=Sitophilus oryzae TaxID=7048 RepID=A0A6J2XSM5_SITOR|nr:coiled-coil domain-containing protein 43 [Sitophilus oryzae]XP_030753620.1 coiled-coil domain-containing protein 43 [Sitophilus oryzae]
MANADIDTPDFSNWLDGKLQELNTDETVFGAYIKGILDSDETTEEKLEALYGIFAEIVENDKDISKICNEILENWQLLKPKDPISLISNVDLNDKLAKLLENQSLATSRQKEYTEEEKKIRDAILSQYSQMTDSEEEDEDKPTGESKSKELEKNINAQLVADAEKQKREHSRLESQKKKEKDKEDREKQKQLKEDKKEKRKTQKGERKR